MQRHMIDGMADFTDFIGRGYDVRIIGKIIGFEILRIWAVSTWMGFVILVLTIRVIISPALIVVIGIMFRAGKGYTG